MPYWLLWKAIPGLSGMFHPDRWILITGLFLSIAAIDGVARRWPLMVWVIPVGVVVQLWVRGATPLPTWTPSIPEHWQALADDPEPGAVIVVPLDHSQLASQYQRIHGRALLGGMIEDQPWRHPDAWQAYVRSNTVLQGLRAISYGQDTAVTLDQEDLTLLYRDGFRRIVFDRASWNNAQRQRSGSPEVRLREAFGRPLFESSSGSIWSIPEPE